VAAADDDDVHDVVVVEAARLDAAIAALVPELSRAHAQRLIDDGHVSLDGLVVTKPSTRVAPGDAIAIAIPPPEPLELVAEDIPLVVLYEDSELIAIDKPAGLVVHPAPGHARGTLVNALLFHCRDLAGVGGVLRPGIVHRLDKDTTGVMVATKTDRAHAALSAAFADKSAARVERTYLAIAAPPPSPAAGTLRTLHGRHPVDRKRFSTKVATGKPAVTHYATLASNAARTAALVRFQLETGRTHQIRVHAADHGFALVGDPVYGHRSRDDQLAAVAGALARQALHAATLAFAHPTTGARLALAAPPPADFMAAAAALGLAVPSA
jgi:23S rRNA pseudouridine1911/1915/1917 synthase